MKERRKQGERRIDLVASDLYEPLDTTTPLNDLKQPLKYMIKYAEKRESTRRKQERRKG